MSCLTFTGLVSDLVDDLVYSVLVLEHEWLQDSVVDQVGATVLARDHEPQKDEAFGERVQWDPEEEEIAKELQDAKKGVDAPVHEPLGVIVLDCRFDGLNS